MIQTIQEKPHILSEQKNSDTIAVREPSSQDNHPRFSFYFVPDIKFEHSGMLYDLDIYAIEEDVIGIPAAVPLEYERAKRRMLLRQGKTTYQNLTESFRLALSRMEVAARTDAPTRQALALLNKIALTGKIGYIGTHGGDFSDFAEDENDSSLAYQLAAENQAGYVDPILLIHDLIYNCQKPNGTPLYDLIYLSACNEQNMPLDLGDLPVPVIMHTGLNTSDGAPAKILI